MMSPQTIEWLGRFADLSLNDRQRLALVYLQQHKRMTNSDYRLLNRVESLTAGFELRGLVETGAVRQNGTGRWTYYSLTKEDEKEEEQPLPDGTEEQRIQQYVRAQGSITNSQCRKLLGVDLHRHRICSRR